ncbi:hypothetical protein MEO93_28905, partial [Dolichospermum sp. ST_sed3]|nr:hypothetical protein [Dolichospermum sp. ST_sed9]MDD1444287.1 hypothetical protein [Dolichospermum sp. ST_sed3]MDD1468855.1 hypothetical protein [Dolichospermum sp. ST_sed5]MDD1474842.1 hypothetical protein [Dolichospermum sp. ST_sed4]
TNLKTKEPWGARCRGVLQYAPTQLMSGLGVTLVAHTHLKRSVWTTPGITNPLPSYIPLNPAINGFLEAFNFNLFDLQESLNIAGLDIKLPIG